MSRTRVIAALCLIGTSIIALLLLFAGPAPHPTYGESPVVWDPENRGSIGLDPTHIVGPDACAECHENEHRVWSHSSHQAEAHTLTRSPEAKRIAASLGVRRIKTDARCASCHYTTQAIEGARPKSISGVSCESCHNAAANWIEPHSRFGPNAATADDETPQHRADRLATCRSSGMTGPDRLYDLGTACYSCHAITDRTLLEEGGHPSGDGFEFASWTQGDIRHNFVRQGIDQNPRSPAERLRVMYLVGAALKLEYALRAADDGTHIDVITGAVANLHAIDEAAEIDALKELIQIGRGVNDDGADKAAAVQRVQTIGQMIAEERVGADIVQLDRLIPPPRTPGREGGQ